MQQFIRRRIIFNYKNLNRNNTKIGVRYKPFHICKNDHEQEPYASIDDIYSTHVDINIMQNN
jgi:hypothetical protein